MKTFIKSAVALCLLGALAAPASAASNLLTNGSFENGFTGWTVTNNEQPGQGAAAPVIISYNQAGFYPTGAYGEAVPTDVAGSLSPDAVGTHALYLSSDTASSPNNAQTISQAVTLNLGTGYMFGFDYYLPANGYANPNNATFTASLDGQAFATFTLGSAAQTTWLNVAKASNTIGGSGTFNFSFTSNGYTAKDIAIDRVYLLAAPVPEPATWGMMLLGFGLVGAAARRSGRKSATALA